MFCDILKTALDTRQIFKFNKRSTLPEQLLWTCGFQRHVHCATESKKHNDKDDAKTSYITVDNSCKSLRVQTSGSTKQNMRIQ